MPTMPLRRSTRLAALQERRRESEENALRQQRERIAQTHRHISRHGAGPSSISMRLPTPPPHSRTRTRVNSAYARARSTAPAPPHDTDRPRLVRQYAIRRHRHAIMANPQLTTRSTNTNVTGRAASSGRFPTRAMRPSGSSGILNSRNDNRPLFLYDTPELRESVFNIGLILGNRYSSDSEDSYFQPRVIDPDAISEDESEEESVPMRELTPPPEPAPLVHRPVTRSMSSRPNFYDDPAPSSSVSRRPPPLPIKKKDSKKSACKCKAGTSSVKNVIKVEKLEPCTICYEDEPKKPVACTYCRQTIGCRYCVKKWFLTTNMSHLDQRTPYPIGGTDRNHKRCPLCRADWIETPQVVSVVCKDIFVRTPQSSSSKPSSDVVMK
uniref:RING-type domain-containing protein n=1 Tax=Panagrolaimus sp. PS1159 TaxID=55785 RepID=A0AC35FU85_9BILA